MSAAVTPALVGAIGVLVLLEFRNPEFARSWRQDRTRLRRNLWYLGATLLIMPLLPALNREVRRFTHGPMDWECFGILEVPACFLVAELLGWLLHYVKHGNRFLWGFHFQHHRDEKFNLWLTVHTHALEVAVSATLIAWAMGVLGFSELATSTYLIFYSFVKVYQHSATSYSVGLLDYLVVGPAYHRLHHHVGSRWNYGVGLTVFDVLFGTARWPERQSSGPERPYGTGSAAELPFGFWKEMGYFLRRDAVRAEHDSTSHRRAGLVNALGQPGHSHAPLAEP
jgi:sterol desaturase/sphingolipid hydroxylase (fatty acid hydroxylase superfamily)